MRKTLDILFLFITAGLLLLSCTKEKADSNNHIPVDCSGPIKSFIADVNPTIQSFCNKAGCHTNGSTNGPGPLTNYNQVFNARSSIRAAIESGLMPQTGNLSAAQRNSIICWIDSGAPNN